MAESVDLDHHPHPGGVYISTYCRHAASDELTDDERKRLHDRCRRTCTICSAPCGCECHQRRGRHG